MRELLRDARERLEVVQRALTALGVARAKARSDELLDERRLPAGGGQERSEMPCVDPEPCDPRARGRDLGLRLAIQMLPGLVRGTTTPYSSSWRDEVA